MPEKTSWSFTEWWKANKDQYNALRKKKYASDPEYHAQVIKHNRASRAKHREIMVEERRQEQAMVKVRVPSHRWAAKLRPIGGITTPVFSIGALSKATGRSVQSLSAWERSGLIPKASYEDKHKHRFYTAERIEEICEALRKLGKFPETVVHTSRTLKSVPVWVRIGTSNKPEKIMISTIGVLAEVLNRKSSTVQQMEKKNMLPVTPFRKGGRRVYSDAMIAIVKDAFDRRGGLIRGKDERLAFHDEIKTAWDALGIADAAIVKAPERKGE